jgi:NADH dehydrogenase [ubiquinone] 1 alpha subcomplex assembly factor 7
VSALLDHLKCRIAAEGPLGLDAYMEEVLAHPEHGYYRTGDPLGRAGDFITAPEISQMFGELIGLWAATVWLAMGRPVPHKLVELGPGRGTLMADAVRVAAAADGFADAIEIHLVETSPVLMQRQKRNLSTLTQPVHWHERFSDVPNGPLVVIANEFLDALPIRQFQRTVTGWCERRVGVCDGALAWECVATSKAPSLAAAPGEIVEVSPIRDAAVREIAARVARDGGAALLIDYGHARTAAGDTLQAIKGHKFHDVLDSPGEADVTSHVDFQAVAEAARGAGALVHGPVGQGTFLKALGIETRTQRLAVDKSRGEAAAIRAAFRRLTGPTEMGELFKVVAITARGFPTPEGFA